ncbi:MAG: acyl-CoA/acyl-ACP dehydrogenase [Chloroflexi bacterium]|nr:acyl-CoA/acyl-ACP dehydrogenase [Chloroflexota bacterium]
MDTELDDRQALLKKVAREFLEKEYPLTLSRQIESTEAGYSKELVQKMAGLGWLGLAIPEKYGGSGGDVIDLILLYEELGRLLACGPHFNSAVLCGQIILAGGSERQKTDWLPRIVRGEALFTLAIDEHEGGYGASAITAAVQDGVLRATKVFVPYSRVADFMICAARTRPGAGEEGISLYVLEAGRSGISHSPLLTITGEKQGEVAFDARVSADDLLGEPHHGWAAVKKALPAALLVQCTEMVGGGEKAMEMAVEYAKQRVQFGRPIGNFQAVQHMCADMKALVDGARYITYRAASKLCSGEAFPPEVAMAKALCSSMYRRVTKDAHQIFGGLGFTMEHDINRYYRRVKALELALGDTDYHVREVSRLAGLS